MEAARPCAVRWLFPRGCAALCLRLHYRTRRHAGAFPGAGGARHPAIRAKAQNPGHAHGLSRSFGQPDAFRVHAMNTRPYAAAKRTLGIADKLSEVNWGLVLLVTLCACAG